MPRSAFRHVLCPIDFSEYSRTALRYAFTLVRRNNGRLTVLFVNDPLLGTAAAAAGYDVSALTAKTGAELRRFAAGAIGEGAAGAGIVTAFGHAAPQIQKAVERLAADVVVLGSRGLTGPGKWFFGSTTERVLRTARVPVLVVPKSRHRPSAGWAKALLSWPGKTILVPVDLRDYAVADVRAALRVARGFGAKALLVYVLPPVQFPPWLRLDRRAHDRDRLAHSKTELETLARLVAGGAECRVVIGDPVDQISACATDAGAGLIILTLKRASAPFGPRQGAISYRLLSTAVAPILAVPETRRQS